MVKWLLHSLHITLGYSLFSSHQQKMAKLREHECLKRRQSLPAMPAGILPASKLQSSSNKIIEEESNRSPKSETKHTGSPINGIRRSSLAVLRRDSCKIS